MKKVIKHSFAALFLLASSVTFANEISADFVKKEIELAHQQYLSGNTTSGLYALQALARLIESDQTTSLTSEIGPNTLSFTYLRMGLLQEKLGDTSKAENYFSIAVNAFKGKEIDVTQLKAAVKQIDTKHS